MSAILKIFGSVLATIGISALHVATVTVLPHPFNTINVTIIALALLIPSGRVGLAIAIAFIMGIITELYAVTAFGFLLLSLMVSLVIGITLARNVITTLSFIGSVLLILIMTFSYRFVFLALILSLSDAQIQAIQSLQSAGIEVLTTTLFGILIVGLYMIKTKRNRGRIIGPLQKRYYG